MLNLLHALAKALEPFHRFDPAGWFAWLEVLTPTAAMVAAFAAWDCVSSKVTSSEVTLQPASCGDLPVKW